MWHAWGVCVIIKRSAGQTCMWFCVCLFCFVFYFFVYKWAVKDKDKSRAEWHPSVFFKTFFLFCIVLVLVHPLMTKNSTSVLITCSSQITTPKTFFKLDPSYSHISTIPLLPFSLSLFLFFFIHLFISLCCGETCRVPSCC